MIEKIGHAKVNLALHVTGQREDRYHLLDTLVVFTEFGDRVRVEFENDSGALVTCVNSGPFGQSLPDGDDNLVCLAALAFFDQLSRKEIMPRAVKIFLEKNLPVASGIGGGSADAAATLLALQSIWDCEVDLDAIAQELGADVPMCLHSRPLRASGIGERIECFNQYGEWPIVLVNSGVEVSTPEVFAKLKDKNNSGLGHLDLDKVPDLEAIGLMRNDLENPALQIVPQVEEVITNLKRTNPLLARMSGSGATCFALYNTQEEANLSCEMIQTSNPDWWCVSTRTIPAGGLHVSN